MNSTNIKISTLDDNNKQRWDNYVADSTNATFFHQAGWREVLERGLGHQCHFLYAEKNEQIVGLLPLANVRSLLFGNSLASTPFCVYGGVLADDAKIKLELENAACELAQRLSVDFLEIRNRVESRNDWQSKDLHVTFRKEIDPDPEKNMLAIPRKQRAMVRKAIKANLVGEIDTSLARFYAAYSESVRNLGTPVFPKKYFTVLLEVFNDQIDILTITKNNDLVASVMSFYFRDEVLPYYGGGTSLARALKGNDFMYWELMRRVCEKGVRIFDYGRSKKGTGSYSFKKNWGFEPTPLHYEFYLVKATSIPDINPLNPKYQMFINLWRRLPLPVANTIGPYIARNLG